MVTEGFGKKTIRSISMVVVFDLQLKNLGYLHSTQCRIILS